jgi:PKD repeat protein
LTNILTAYVSGKNVQAVYYRWDVNADGVIDQQGWDKRVITNVYELPGLYSVALSASNEDGTVDSFTNVNYISVSTLAMYVSPGGSHVLPYGSWATAATTIQAAVSFAADGGTINITNGLYVLTNTVVLSLGTTLKGVNGAAATVIAGNGIEQCFAINHGGAVLDGLTISNGYAVWDGGGLALTTGTVQNCIIRDNTASRYGGGVYLVNGLLKNCVIFRNVTRGAVQPLATAGGGVYMINGSMQHCTLADNTAVRGGVNAGDGLVMTGGTVSNSIVYFNSVFPYQQTQRNVYKTGGTFVYSCTTPAITGTGNTTAEPQFVDRLAGNYQLLPGSPCIDRGTNLAGVVSDLEGISRPQDGDTLAGAVSDMGAYEALPLTQGVLRCNFIASTNEASGGLSNVIFTVYVAGSDTNIASYQWDFTNDGADDMAGAGLNPVTNSYAVGFHSVRLTITNGLTQGHSLIKPAYIRVASPALYVAPDGLAELPYDTWGKAATNLNAAVEAAYTVGCTQSVFVTNGIYAVDRQLELNGPVVLAGVNGASNTMAVRNGAYMHRLVSLNHAAAIVDGLTLTNGLEDTTAYGGGVLMTAGRLQNCIVIKNIDTGPSASQPYGGGVNATGGVISNCVIRANQSLGSYAKAGGLNVVNATVKHCVIESNYAQESPANGGLIVAGASRVENCLFRANNGAAVNAAGTTLIRNCTLVGGTGGNPAMYLGGSSTALNCIVYYNVAPDVSVVAPAVMQYSCTSNVVSGAGNITNAPLFVNRAAGDFRLMPKSPCINAGLMAGWTAGDADLDGHPRIVGGMVDMGAFENQLLSGTLLFIQ